MNALLASLALLASTTGYVRSRVDTGVAHDPAAHCLWWKAGSLSFAQNTAGNPDAPGAGSFSAVSAAYGTWNAVAARCGNFTLAESARTASRDVGYDQHASDNVNLVVFRGASCRDKVPAGDSCWNDGDCNNKYDCWQYSSATIGLTTTTYDRNTGQVYDADMELNAANFNLTTADAPPCTPGVSSGCVSSDVQNTVTHEVGHFLGLDHASAAGSTMYASAPLGETSKRTLDPDSAQFICDAYPAGRPSQDCVLPPAPRELGNAAGCSASAGAWAAPLLALSAWLAAARRRRGGR